MDTEVNEFQDWEVLQHSSDWGVAHSVDAIATGGFDDEFEGDSEGIIRADYFSVDSRGKYAKTPDVSVEEEGGSVESDNPSWIDPASETPYPRNESGGFWSDSGSDRSADRKLAETGVDNEIDFVENEKIEVPPEGVGEIVDGTVDSGKLWLDSGGIGQEIVADSKSETCEDVKSQECADEQGGEKENVLLKPTGEKESEKNNVVWWKVPLELLKYCVLRVSPVWTFSMVAAVMGLVILGRRLYKMKRKSRNLELKVTVDDKKVSQFMSRAARLNEAFSVVRRVPVIRPLLPAAGVTQWPVMSLR